MGPMDCEVGQSLGHLASLYAYQMEAFDKAEELYFRSIDIGEPRSTPSPPGAKAGTVYLGCCISGLNLFGQAYSGLMYDYRGLQHIYHKRANEAKRREFADKLQDWQRRRSQNSMPEFLRHLLADPRAHYEPAPTVPTTLADLRSLFDDAFAEKFGSLEDATRCPDLGFSSPKSSSSAMIPSPDRMKHSSQGL